MHTEKYPNARSISTVASTKQQQTAFAAAFDNQEQKATTPVVWINLVWKVRFVLE